MKNNKIFNYTEILLIFSFFSENKNEKKLKNSSCTIFELNQSDYRLKCRSEESLNGEILKGFSYLNDSNLVIIFKDNENKIEIDPWISNKFYTKKQKGLSAGGIIAIILPCIFVLIIILLILLFKLKKTHEKDTINLYNNDSSISNLKI